MKIAVAAEGNYVSPHFGHCEGFAVYSAGEEQVMKKTFLPNPGHRPGFLPVFLKENDVEVIIAGGMGETAQELFREQKIKVFVGIQGFCDDAARSFLKGELRSSGAVCHEHQHEGSCQSHSTYES